MGFQIPVARFLRVVTSSQETKWQLTYISKGGVAIHASNGQLKALLSGIRLYKVPMRRLFEGGVRLFAMQTVLLVLKGNA